MLLLSSIKLPLMFFYNNILVFLIQLHITLFGMSLSILDTLYIMLWSITLIILPWGIFDPLYNKMNYKRKNNLILGIYMK